MMKSIYLNRLWLFAILIWINAHFLLAQENSVMIVWKEKPKLSWKDFRGQPKKESPHFAISSTGSVFDFSLQEGTDSATIIFETYAVFNRDSSWAKKWGRSYYLLKHEQTHFDITEIFIRKLRKSLSEYQFSESYQLEIQKIIKYFDAERNKKQSQYDLETQHSLIEPAQIKWNDYIAKELKRFDAYKEHKVYNKVP